MGKLNCRCGWQISDVSSPSSNNGRLLSDVQLDRLPEEHADVHFLILTNTIDVWECTECGSIAFGNHHDAKVTWYRPDNKPPNRLMEAATITPKDEEGR